MNKEMALQGIETLIQDGNNVLKTMRNSELVQRFLINYTLRMPHLSAI